MLRNDAPYHICDLFGKILIVTSDLFPKSIRHPNRELSVSRVRTPIQNNRNMVGVPRELFELTVEFVNPNSMKNTTNVLLFDED